MSRDTLAALECAHDLRILDDLRAELAVERELRCVALDLLYDAHCKIVQLREQHHAALNELRAIRRGVAA